MTSAQQSLPDFPLSFESVRWSIAIQRVPGGQVLYRENADVELKTASIGKLQLLIHIASEIAAGRSRLGDILSRSPGDHVADSGIWQRLSVDSLTIADLCELVGSVSDNLATNVLLRHFGLDRVALTSAELGLKSTGLHDYVRDIRGPEHPSTLSTGSAAELADLMANLNQGLVFSDQVSRQVLAWLANGMDLSQVGAGWGLDPLAHQQIDRGIRVHHKTGTDTDVRGDIGLVTGPAGTVAYAVIANWEQSTRDESVRTRVLQRQAEIGEQILLAANDSQLTIFSPASQPGP